MITIYRCPAIHTMNVDQPTAEAVAVSGDRILAVGSYGNVMEAVNQARVESGAQFEIDDRFAKAVALPGLIDQHLHPLLAATTLSTAVVATEDWVLPDATYPAANSAEEYRHRLTEAEAALTDPEEWLLSWGYHELWHGPLSRAVLDDISQTRPIGIWQRSCHEWYMNTPAMAALGIDEAWLAAKTGPETAMVDLANGHFWEGGFFNLVMGKVAPVLISRERMERGLHQMVAYLHQNGVTAYNEPGISWRIEPFDLYQEILGADDTPLWSTFLVDGRVQAARNMPVTEVIADANEQVARAPDGKVMLFDKQVKLFADGAIISQRMQMVDPYLDANGDPNPGHVGEWMMEPETYAAYFDAYWEAGWQIHTHVNGDAGLEVVLDTLEAAQQRLPRTDHRCVIVHFANSTEAQVERIARLGAIVSANPYYPCGFADRYREVGLGPDRADVMVRARSVIDNNVSLSFHSDLPMGPAQPLQMAWFAANRITQSGRVAGPEQRIGIYDAIAAVTREAAYSWRQEDEIGTIEPGKRANFTIVDRDPFAGGPEDLNAVNVLGTVYEGRWFPVPAERRASRRWGAPSDNRPGVFGKAEPAASGNDGAESHGGSCGCEAAHHLAAVMAATGT